MKNIIKSILVVILMMQVSVTNVNADEIVNNDNKIYMVALGDSISAGYMLEDSNNSFINKLRKKLGKEIVDYSTVGDTTSDLLDKLNTKEVMDSLKKAENISLNIGGNNIQGPFKEALYKAVKQYTGKEYEEAVDELGISDISKIIDILTGDNDINKEMVQAMSNNVDDFIKEFDEAVNIIKENNKDANIIIQTVYNPFYDVYGIDAMSDIAEEYINTMNEKIISKVKEINATLLDVNSQFKYYGTMSVTNILDIDTHPNMYGHNIIYIMYMDILSDEIPYEVENNIENTKISCIKDKNQVTTITIEADDKYYLPKEIKIQIGEDNRWYYVGENKNKYELKVNGKTFVENMTIEGECSAINLENNSQSIDTTNEDKNDSSKFNEMIMPSVSQENVSNPIDIQNKKIGIQTGDKEDMIKYSITMTISMLIMLLSIKQRKQLA